MSVFLSANKKDSAQIRRASRPGSLEHQREQRPVQAIESKRILRADRRRVVPRIVLRIVLN
jgi:hypothetical protein